jgi:hypothetical protein
MERTWSHTPEASLLSQLKANRDTWNVSRITSYRYIVDIECRCVFEVRPVTIVVRDGELTSITDPSGDLSEPSPLYELAYHYSTADRIFKRIETDLSVGYDIQTTYERATGFPVRIHVGQRGLLPDSGSTITLSDFQVLQ